MLGMWAGKRIAEYIMSFYDTFHWNPSGAAAWWALGGNPRPEHGTSTHFACQRFGDLWYDRVRDRRVGSG